jgi:hypothetical protein
MIGSAEEFFRVESGRRIVHDSPLEDARFEPLVPLVFALSETGRALPERLSEARQACPAGGSGGRSDNL